MKAPVPVTTSPRSLAPTRRQLVVATAVAMGLAALVLVTIILPAEYGIDPTGVGEQLGLRRSRISSAPISAAAAATVSGEGEPFRTDQLEVTLAWGEDVEIKATMQQGQSFVFTWEAVGGPVNFDMHGEPLDARNGDATSYAKAENETRVHGTFRAPFDGKHGWYWENYNDNPVTIRLRTSGFYSHIARQ